MFEFVNSTTDSLDHGVDSKRKIRSHAMKDYRSRQRNERLEERKVKQNALRTSRKPSRLTFRFVHTTDNATGLNHDVPTSQRSTPLLLRPSVWGNETTDIFESPGQLQMMFGLCRECSSFLHVLDAVLTCNRVPILETRHQGRLRWKANRSCVGPLSLPYALGCKLPRCCRRT